MDAVYHLVNTSFTFEQALRYCRGQSSGLTTSGVKEDEEGARKLLSKSSLQGPVWFQTNKKQNPTTTLALPKQSKFGYDVGYKINMWPWTTKPVLSSRGIFVEIANNT